MRFGPIDSVKILPEKSCAFISFLDGTTAAAFHSDALMRKVRLHDQDLKIGWGKPSAVPPAILMAVQQSGATRNVYLGNLDESVTEQTLRDDLSRFGPIDQVKIVRGTSACRASNPESKRLTCSSRPQADKNIGFVHFLSISTAIKVVQTLATEPEWSVRAPRLASHVTDLSSAGIQGGPARQLRQGPLRVRAEEPAPAAAAQHGRGRDGLDGGQLRRLRRHGRVPEPGLWRLRRRHEYAAPLDALRSWPLEIDVDDALRHGLDGQRPQLAPREPHRLPRRESPCFSVLLFPRGQKADSKAQNIHPETTTEEICNTIRGGILQQIRYIPDKHIVRHYCSSAYLHSLTRPPVSAS